MKNRTLTFISFIVSLLFIAFTTGCSKSAKVALGECKFEADKVMANKVKGSGSWFEKQEEEAQRTKLICSCMESKGFELDIDKVLKETPFSEPEAVNYDYCWKRQESVLMQKIKKWIK